MIRRILAYLRALWLPQSPGQPEASTPSQTPRRRHRMRSQPPSGKSWSAIADGLFKPYAPPPGVRGENALAMDEIPGLSAWFMGGYGGSANGITSMIEDGLNFKGYAQLAAMMLRAEFRKPVETIAKECTREWIKFKSRESKPGETEPEAVQAKIQALEVEFKRLHVREVVRRHITDQLGFGLAHIWIGISGTGKDSKSQTVPLKINSKSIKKGAVEKLVNIDPIWTNPNNYNADNPLDEFYYKPKTWWVQGIEIDASRLLTVVPFQVPDILKPAFNFGGLSLTQMLEAYVHNFLRTRGAVSDLVSNFATKILMTNMAGNMQTASGLDYGDIDADGVTSRVNAMNAWQSNNGTFVIDKESEDFKLVQIALGGLHELQAQSLEFMASIPGIPLVKMFGNQPTGLGASSEGEIRVFYDEISAFQEANVEPVTRPIFHLAQLNLWGEIDDSLDYEFVPLWQLSEKEAAEVEKIKADMDALNIQEGKITPDEAREREAADPHSIYSAINLTGPAPEPPDSQEFDPAQTEPDPKVLMSGDN